MRAHYVIFFFSSRRRHTRCSRDWSSDVCSSDLTPQEDLAIINAADFQELNQKLTDAHSRGHTHIGGTLEDAHTYFRDPFVFLLYTNVDRPFAMWQPQPSHPERLNPNLAYGTDTNSKGSGDVDQGEPNWGIMSPLEPWGGS